MLSGETLAVATASPQSLKPAFDFWREHWTSEFKGQNLNGVSTKNSDDFRASDQIRTLKVAGELAALMLVSVFDLDNAWDRQSSYFNAWPEDVFVTTYGTRIRALRYFVVHPNFRRRSDLRAGATLLALCLRDFVYSTDERLIGMTLKENGADVLTAKFGMTRIGPVHQKKYGVDVEYMHVTKGALNTGRMTQLLVSVADDFKIGSGERRTEDLPRIMADEKTRGLA